MTAVSTACRPHRAACLIAARRVALAGCASSTFTTATAPSESEDSQLAASPANIASLSGVVQRNPNDPQAVNMRGTVYGQAGRNQEALADFNKAISLDPNYTQAYANRALIYRKTGKLDLALADYNKALELDQNYAVAYIGRGIVLPPAAADAQRVQRFQQGDRDPARQRAGLFQSRPALSEPAPAPLRDRRLLDRDRPHAERGRAVHRPRAELHVDQRLQGRRRRSRRRGLGDPQNLQAWTSRGLAYERLGDKERPPAPTPRRSTSSRTTNRPRPASPASADKMGQTYQTF